MNKKTLIGSIIAITVLIGVSFSSVIGYRSVKSNVITSPLFNIRTNRAIDKQNVDLKYQYVGKDNDINLIIPDRNYNIERIQKSIGFIQSMNDETFNKFLNLVINRIQTNNEFKDVKIDDLILSLNRIRNNQELIILNSSNIKRDYSFRYDFVPTICWFPGCASLALILLGLYAIFAIGIIILYYIVIITIFLITSASDCLHSFPYPCYTEDCVFKLNLITDSSG